MACWTSSKGRQLWYQLNIGAFSWKVICLYVIELQLLHYRFTFGFIVVFAWLLLTIVVRGEKELVLVIDEFGLLNGKDCHLALFNDPICENVEVDAFKSITWPLSSSLDRAQYLLSWSLHLRLKLVNSSFSAEIPCLLTETFFTKLLVQTLFIFFIY